MCSNFSFDTVVVRVNYATAAKVLNLIPDTIPTGYIMSNIKKIFLSQH